MTSLGELIEQARRPGGFIDRKQAELVDELLQPFESEMAALLELCKRVGLQPSEWKLLTNEQKLFVLRSIQDDESEHQWSHFRSPKEWRAELKDAGRSASEDTWRRLREKHLQEIDGEPKSCRVTRTLADSWGLTLQEFTDEPRT